MLELLRAVLPAATAFAMGKLISELAEGRYGNDFLGMGYPLAALGLILLANQLTGAFVPPVQGLAIHQIDGVHRRRVCEHALIDTGASRIEDPEVQDLIHAAASDPSNWTEKTPGDGAVAQLKMIFRYIGLASSAAVLASFSWWLIPAAVIPAFIIRTITQRQWLGINREWAAGIQESRKSDYWAGLTSTSSAGKDMRLFGFGEWIVQRQQRHRLQHFEPVWHKSGKSVSNQWIQFLLTAVPLIGIYYLSAAHVVQHEDLIGLLAASLAATWGVFTAIAGNEEAFAIEGALPVVRAFEKLSEATPKSPADSAQPSSGWRRTPSGDPPEIRFESVSFSYPRARHEILSNLNLIIRPGEVTAIVGMNGAGKTTLTKILSGLYQPTSGRVVADGVDIRDIGLDTWRRELAVVFQDFIKYESSVKDNIVLGKAAHMHDERALERTIDDAHLSALLGGLPSGMHTPLTRTLDGGVDLSGGQWQQIALARSMFALHTGATVLVLDEPTAHLDVRTEFALFRRLTEAAKNASVILISHRLSTVREADRIVLIDDGRLAESGSHDELMDLNGKYATMFSLQASRFQLNGEMASMEAESRGE